MTGAAPRTCGEDQRLALCDVLPVTGGTWILRYRDNGQVVLRSNFLETEEQFRQRCEDYAVRRSNTHRFVALADSAEAGA